MSITYKEGNIPPGWTDKDEIVHLKAQIQNMNNVYGLAQLEYENKIKNLTNHVNSDQKIIADWAANCESLKERALKAELALSGKTNFDAVAVALKAQRDNYENLAIENHASVTRLMEECDRLKASEKELYEALKEVIQFVSSEYKFETECGKVAISKYEEANKPEPPQS